MSEAKDLPTAGADSDFVADTWTRLRSLTPARVALGRVGYSLRTRDVLALRLDHSRARDAIWCPLDTAELCNELVEFEHPFILLRSRATSRRDYLVRPELGRRLIEEDCCDLTGRGPCDIVFVLSDGLSPIAIQRHAVPLLRVLWPKLSALTIGPLIVVTQARVAIADEVAELLDARLAISIIGERPGLSSPDSLGIYLTYGARVGTTDEARNCISNIRPDGLTYDKAADILDRLIRIALVMGASGIPLQKAAGMISESMSHPVDQRP